MSAPRNPPPDLPGFEFLKGLGGGGFADVFLYQQRRPSRQVAVKVLRDEHLSDANLLQFEREADLMAELSAHPNIVTIFSADVAPDGRPFIVMEYCPQPHFGLRARGGQMAVAEALRVGVQVAAAVDAAHTAGILHRDIKPANILTTAYGDPGLTDFGIAGVTRESEIAGAGGLSYAYSAPEVIQDPNLTGSIAADVYALGATTYCLFAGRSPFWIPGGDNADGALIARILAGGPPPTGRGDVPPELERLLAQALDRDPTGRPHSADALAHALQDVELALRLAPTPIPEMKSHAPPTKRPSDDDGTRRSNVSVVDPDPEVVPTPPPLVGAPPGPARSPAEQRWIDPDDPATMRREGRARPRPQPDAPEPETDTGPSPGPPVPSSPTDTEPDRHRRLPWIQLTGAAALAAVLGLGVYVGTRNENGGPPTTPPVEEPDTLPPSAPDPPEAVAASLVDADGVATLRVTIGPESDSADGLEFLISRSDGEPWPDGQRLVVDADPSGVTTVNVDDMDPGAPLCVDVYAKKESLLSPSATSTCTDNQSAPTAPTNGP